MECSVPLRTVRRLTYLYQTAYSLIEQGQERISSTQLEEITGIPAATIRKDLQYVGSIGQNGSGYQTRSLAEAICRRFQLDRGTRACIVGLGRLGQAILNYEWFYRSGYEMVAGFDVNSNKIETLPARVRLYPAWQMSEVIRREEIRLGIITVPAQAAPEVLENLIEAGITDIINFAPYWLQCPDKRILIRNIDILQEFRVLSALRSLQE